MKNFLKSELYRILLCNKTILGVCGVCLTLLLSNSEDLYYCLKYDSGSILYIFEMVTNGGWFFSIIYLLTAFTSSTGFCEDINDRYLYGILVRTKRSYYCISKIIGCFLETMAIVFLGFACFLGFLSVFLPVIGEPDEIPYIALIPYRTLLLENKICAYFVIKILLISISASFWSCIGLMLSAMNPDKFLTISSPFILNYIISRLQLYMPDWLNLDYMATGYPIFGNDAGWLCTVIYSFSIYLSLTFLAAYIFYRRVQGYINGKNY